MNFRNQLVYEKNMTTILVKLQDPSFQGVAIYDEATLNGANYNREKKLNFNVIDRKIVSYNFGIKTNPFSCLEPVFVKNINQLIEAGFFQLWFHRARSHRSLAEIIVEDNKVVLTLNHLGVGFTIWLCVLSFAVLAFIAECLMSKLLK